MTIRHNKLNQLIKYTSKFEPFEDGYTLKDMHINAFIFVVHNLLTKYITIYCVPGNLFGIDLETYFHFHIFSLLTTHRMQRVRAHENRCPK